MKIYRVAADFYQPNFMRTFGYKHSFESIYYKLGYTPFYGGIERGYANNIGIRMKEEGKFFFLFPEDAYECARDIMCYQFPELYSWTSKILEYDFPIEVVLKLVGYGIYDSGNLETIETNIPKSEFSNDKIMSSDIDKAIKDEIFKIVCAEILEFLNYFREKQNKTLINRDDFIRKVEKEDRFYHEFMNDNIELYKSSHLTGNYWNMCMVADSICGMYTNSSKDTEENLRENGLILDFSSDSFSRRREILREIKKGDIDKAKILLLDYNKRKR